MKLTDIKIGKYYYVFLSKYYTSIINTFCIVKVINVNIDRNEVSVILINPKGRVDGQFVRIFSGNIDFKFELNEDYTNKLNSIFESKHNDLLNLLKEVQDESLK